MSGVGLKKHMVNLTSDFTGDIVSKSNKHNLPRWCHFGAVTLNLPSLVLLSMFGCIDILIGRQNHTKNMEIACAEKRKRTNRKTCFATCVGDQYLSKTRYIQIVNKLADIL